MVPGSGERLRAWIRLRQLPTYLGTVDHTEAGYTARPATERTAPGEIRTFQSLTPAVGYLIETSGLQVGAWEWEMGRLEDLT